MPDFSGRGARGTPTELARGGGHSAVVDILALATRHRGGFSDLDHAHEAAHTIGMRSFMGRLDAVVEAEGQRVVAPLAPAAPPTDADGTLIVPAGPCDCPHKHGQACCIILNPVPLPWLCHERLANCCGGHLASIHSNREHCAAATCALYGWAWIGGRRTAAGYEDLGDYGCFDSPGPRGADSWEWSDGTPWDYTNFMCGEPNNGCGGEEDRILLHTCCTQWNDCGQVCCCAGLYQWRLPPTIDAQVRPVKFVTLTGNEIVVGAHDTAWHSASSFAAWAQPLLVARDFCGSDDKLTFVLESGGIVPAATSGEEFCQLGNAMARHLQVSWTADRPLKVVLTFSAVAARVETEPVLCQHGQPNSDLHAPDTGVDTGSQLDNTSSQVGPPSVPRQQPRLCV